MALGLLTHTKKAGVAGADVVTDAIDTRGSLSLYALVANMGSNGLSSSFTDDFNRTNNTDLGASWTEESSFGADVEILTNQLVFNANNNVGSCAKFDAVGDILSQYSMLKYKSTSVPSGQIGAGPVCRMQNTGLFSNYYVFEIRNNFSTGWSYSLNFANNASAALVIETGSLSAPSANDIFMITAVDTLTGVELRMWINGIQHGSTYSYVFASPYYLGAGKPGVARTVTVTGTSSLTFDDWQGGAASSVVPPEVPIVTDNLGNTWTVISGGEYNSNGINLSLCQANAAPTDPSPSVDSSHVLTVQTSGGKAGVIFCCFSSTDPTAMKKILLDGAWSFLFGDTSTPIKASASSISRGVTPRSIILSSVAQDAAGTAAVDNSFVIIEQLAYNSINNPQVALAYRISNNPLNPEWTFS